MVIRYFGSKAPCGFHSVASVSGYLAVCSCTVLPLFVSIYRRGAGIGPAVAFLYSGPAINVLAIVLTARILGWDLGVARVVGAVLFAVVIGLVMAVLFRKDDRQRLQSPAQMGEAAPESRSGTQTRSPPWCLLIFATWGRPADYDL